MQIEITAPRRARERHALWIPGWLLFGTFLLFFALLHLRSLGWARGMLFESPRFYWETVEWLISRERIYLSKHAPEAQLHRYLMAGAMLALNAAALLAVVRARRYPAGITLRSIIKWTIVFSVPLILVPNLFSADIYSYIIFGRIPAIHNGNPFTHIPSLFWNDLYLNYVNWRNMASVYGPVWIHVSYALTVIVEALGGGLWLYQLAYKLVSAIPHLINIALLWGILGRWKPQQQVWGTVLYAWSPLALIEFAGNAHNDVLMITLLLLALWLHLLRRPYLALLALVAAVLLKWVVAAFLPLYGILLLWEAPNWRSRARLVMAGSALAVAFTVLVYAPYWGGVKTLRILTKAPPSTMAINSLGDMVIHEVQYQRYLAGQGPNPWISRRPTPARSASVARAARLPADDLEFDEQFKREQRTQNNERRTEISEMILRTKQMEVTERVLRRLGAALFILAWLWWAYRTRSLETMIRGWAWLSFIYVAFTSIWFWPWYVTWFIALAALLDWRRTAMTAFVFGASVIFLYIIYPTRMPPQWFERYRALIMFGPPLLYLAGTFIVGLWKRQRQDEPEASLSQHSKPVQSGAG